MKYNIRGVDINYEIVGNGKPIIMIHGFAADYKLMSSCMEPVFNANSNFKRIYLDLPGMGDSASDDWINCSDRMLEVIIEFIRKLIPNENFLLAGQSYGAYISRGIVYKMPERVDGILLICPCIIADRNKRNTPQKITLFKDEELMLNMPENDSKYFSSAIVVQNKSTYERYKSEVLSGIRKADTNFLRSILKNGYGFSFDVDKLNNKYFKPTLMILGRQDSQLGYRDAWGILENFPRATFAVLDRSGHNLQIEQSEVFECLISEWLRRVTEEK